MFPDDMTSQHLKLSDTLSYTVRNKNRPEVVEETIVGLARRHAKLRCRTRILRPSWHGPDFCAEITPAGRNVGKGS